jgi:hypothetical protein
MRFNPRANDPIVIVLREGRLSCRCSAHPNPVLAGAGLPHAMTSDTSTVYHIVEEGNHREHALKVMAPEHRDTRLVTVSQILASLAGTPGLTVAKRVCLTADTAALTLDRYPELKFATLMPWLSGTSWFDAHQGHASTSNLTPWRCFRLAMRLAFIAVELERRGLTHNVLAPANVLVETDAGHDTVELVGLEDIGAHGLEPSRRSPDLVAGYRHPAADQTPQLETADRFGLALLICELLTWHTGDVRRELYGAESYFDPLELGRDCQRFDVLLRVVEGIDLPLGVLLKRTWRAHSPSGCPTAAEWHDVLTLVSRSRISLTWYREHVYCARAETDIDHAARRYS